MNRTAEENLELWRAYGELQHKYDCAKLEVMQVSEHLGAEMASLQEENEELKRVMQSACLILHQMSPGDLECLIAARGMLRRSLEERSCD